MPRTTPRIQFGLYALEVKRDATPTADTAKLQPFSKVVDLKTDAASERPFASYEPDYWLLDGEHKFKPADDTGIHIGLMSLAMSDGDGVFADPPVMTVTFSKDQSTNGLSLRFGQWTNDYASSFRVDFYDASNALIFSNTYYPSSAETNTSESVDDFRKIIITFLGTNKPYRYLRLKNISYGELITFEGDQIKEAKVAEAANQLSDEVQIGSLFLRLHSTNAQFSILNPEGYYAALTERQPLAVYEMVDNSPVFIGQFFLTSWKNVSDTEIEFEAEDLISILDKTSTMGGLWTGSGIALQDLLQTLLDPAGIPFELDPQLYDVPVVGWIKVGTLRQALQQIAFAVGASVSCARSWVVRIYKSKFAATDEATATITRAQKGQHDQSITLKPQIAGVEVTSHNYYPESVSIQLHSGALGVGQHEILFARPMRLLSIANATIVQSGANYALINVPYSNNVSLTGYSYVDTLKVSKIYDPAITKSIKAVQRVTDALLINPTNQEEVTQRIYNYFQERYFQKLKLYAPTVQVGDVVLVDTLYNSQVKCVIERMQIDLVKGMTVMAEMTGIRV